MTGNELFGPDGTQPAGPADPIPGGVPDDTPTPPEWPAVSLAERPGDEPVPPPTTAEPRTAPRIPPSPRTAEHGLPQQRSVEQGPPPRAAEPAPPPPRPDARPPVTDTEPSLLGLTRRSRSRIGSRLFTAVFVAIFLIILVQTIVRLMTGG